MNARRVTGFGRTFILTVASGLLLCGCAATRIVDSRPPRPSIAPEPAPPTAAIDLSAIEVEPMYTELMAINLDAIVEVALADNVDILQAREAIKVAEGKVEARVGAAFPAIVPTAMFDHVDGTVRATEGNLEGVGFNTFQASIAIQWLINPGRVIHEITAAKKRLASSHYEHEAVSAEVLRVAVHQYYELVLAQAAIQAAHQSVAEADELYRITKLRSQAGTGVRADELCAEAQVARRKQDLVKAVRAFRDASVALSVTLRLEPTITLVPDATQLAPVHLVRDDLTIDDLLGFALTFRPELESVRNLVEASLEEKDATWWGRFGPEFALGYQYGGITGNANNVKQGGGIPSNLIVNPSSPSGSFSANPIANGLTREGILRGSRRAAGSRDQTFGFSDQQRASAGISWRLSLAAIGDLKSAAARTRLARLEAERRLDQVKAQVVSAAQASEAHNQLIDLARQQVTAAEEALRLSELNVQAGTATALDVLQTQDAVSQARLRFAAAVARYNQAQVDLVASLGLLDRAVFLKSDA